MIRSMPCLPDRPDNAVSGNSKLRSSRSLKWIAKATSHEPLSLDLLPAFDEWYDYISCGRSTEKISRTFPDWHRSVCSCAYSKHYEASWDSNKCSKTLSHVQRRVVIGSWQTDHSVSMVRSSSDKHLLRTREMRVVRSHSNSFGANQRVHTQ